MTRANKFTRPKRKAVERNAMPTTNPDTFYILWDPSSARPPGKRFTSREEAERIAAEWGAKVNSKEMYVMMCVAVARRPCPVLELERIN
jgi:hypothetical protein